MGWWKRSEPILKNVHRIESRGLAGIFKLFFWITQIVLGLPCLFYGFELVTRGRADGIINVIGLFLAWIGGTLTWGIAAIMHERFYFSLPAVYRVAIEQNNAASELAAPTFDDTYKGFPYRTLRSGAVEVSTADGLKTYASFNEFQQIIG
jgi:hypothetical protein